MAGRRSVAEAERSRPSLPAIGTRPSACIEPRGFITSPVAMEIFRRQIIDPDLFAFQAVCLISADIKRPFHEDSNAGARQTIGLSAEEGCKNRRKKKVQLVSLQPA